MNIINTNKNLKEFKSSVLDWNTIQMEMKKKLGLDVYDSWLKKINFLEEQSNYIILSVPTRFIRDWITSRYLDQILKIVKQYKKNIIRIEFKINNLETNKNFIEEASQIPKTEEKISFIKDSYLQYNRIDPNKRFDNFLTGSSNKLAYEASLKVSEKIS